MSELPERLRERATWLESRSFAELHGGVEREAADEIERLKDAIRVRGGCRMLSLGDECDCGLCLRDAEIKRLQLLANAGVELAGHVTRAIATGAKFDELVLRHWAERVHELKRVKS